MAYQFRKGVIPRQEQRAREPGADCSRMDAARVYFFNE